MTSRGPASLDYMIIIVYKGCWGTPCMTSSPTYNTYTRIFSRVWPVTNIRVRGAMWKGVKVHALRCHAIFWEIRGVVVECVCATISVKNIEFFVRSWSIYTVVRSLVESKIPLVSLQSLIQDSPSHLRTIHWSMPGFPLSLLTSGFITKIFWVFHVSHSPHVGNIAQSKTERKTKPRLQLMTQ